MRRFVIIFALFTGVTFGQTKMPRPIQTNPLEVSWTATQIALGGKIISVAGGKLSVQRSKTNCAAPSYSSCNIIYVNSSGVVLNTTSANTALASGNSVVAFVTSDTGKITRIVYSDQSAPGVITGGGGGLSGSIAADQLAFGAGADTIGGSAKMLVSSSTGSIDLNGGQSGGVLPSTTLLLRVGTGGLGSTGSGVAAFVNDAAGLMGSLFKGTTTIAYAESSNGATTIIGSDVEVGPLADSWTSVSGMYVESDNQGSGTVTDLIGIDIFLGNFGGGGVTTATGLRIADLPSAAVTKLAIKTGTGKIEFDDLKTTGAATGKKVVCVDTSTGILYASSSGTDCAN